MALFSYPVCTWLCQYVNMGVRKWLEKSAEKQKYKMRKTANPLSRKAFRAVSFSATKDKKEGHPYGCPSFLHWTQLGAAAPELRPSAYGVQMHRQSSSARYLILKDLLRPPFRRWKQGAAPDRISACRPPPNPRPNRGDFLCRSPRKSG